MKRGRGLKVRAIPVGSPNTQKLPFMVAFVYLKALYVEENPVRRKRTH